MHDPAVPDRYSRPLLKDHPHRIAPLKAIAAEFLLPFPISDNRNVQQYTLLLHSELALQEIL
ncbi:hypothetical protein D3C85_1148490 [compost metagenome]